MATIHVVPSRLTSIRVTVELESVTDHLSNTLPVVLYEPADGEVISKFKVLVVSNGVAAAAVEFGPYPAWLCATTVNE